MRSRSRVVFGSKLVPRLPQSQFLMPTASRPKADDKARNSCYSLRIRRARPILFLAATLGILVGNSRMSWPSAWTNWVVLAMRVV